MKIQSLYMAIIALASLLFLHGCKKDDTTGLPPISNLNDLPVGRSAKDLLTASPYTSLKIEIQYMPGYQPDAASVTNLSNFINMLLNKPGGVSIIQTQIPASGKTVLSLTEIAAIEKANRTVFTTGSQLGVYFLYTDGGYTEGSTLGIAYRNTSMSLMGKTIHDNSGSLGQASRTKLESTVLQHEMAHILGLVDIGTPMQTNHKDPARGNHCNNSSCLMYYASETTDILGILITGSIPPLDNNCRADLTANGGK